ncbi:MAG: hypothetical protein ACREEA_08540, partial [Stellaceae bacterium]
MLSSALKHSLSPRCHPSLRPIVPRRKCIMPVLLRLFAVIGFAAAATLAVADEGPGNKEEAKALLDRAIAHVNAVGTEKAFADFTNKAGGFTDRDLYVYCFDMQGVTMA